MRDITIRNATEHNLKRVSVKIPRRKITVLTGVSGSGKSSLAYNIVYAEGQRRYLETLSPYARHFIHAFDKPKVEWIDGLSPTISIRQNQGLATYYSTVGTISEIFDYLRLLFYSCANNVCSECGRELEELSPEELSKNITTLSPSSKIMILSSLVKGRKGKYIDLLANLARKGFKSVRIDGRIMNLGSRAINISAIRKHNIDVVIGQHDFEKDPLENLINLCKKALETNPGEIIINQVGKSDIVISSMRFCINCGKGVPLPQPSTFSFLSKNSRCPWCNGMGEVLCMRPEIVFSNHKLQLLRWNCKLVDNKLSSIINQSWYKTLASYSINPALKLKDLNETTQKKLLAVNMNGEHCFSTANILWNYAEGFGKDEKSALVSMYFKRETCPECKGARLNEIGRSFRINTYSIGDLANISIRLLHNVLTNFERTLLPSHPHASTLLREMIQRVETLIDVGLGYLSLNRSANTLSSGELQRLRLASRLHKGMGGVLYVLDEPTIGLHPYDLEKFLLVLKNLKQQGNTLLVVEHDKSTILASDHIIDLGPGGGTKGGKVIYEGSLKDFLINGSGKTYDFLKGKKLRFIHPHKKTIKNKGLYLKGITTNNLRNINLFVPFGTLCVVTGVSGAGKSSLVFDTLYPLLRLYVSQGIAHHPGVKFARINVALRNIYTVDQKPVGRTPRSTIATYSGVFDEIRTFFSRLAHAQVSGLKPGHFSFNTSLGRCSHCEGLGVIKSEMKFLPNTYTTCPICEGRRFQPDVLKVKFRGKSIADVLDMCIGEGVELFSNFSSIKRKLMVLCDIGMDYIQLGQPTPTLSGGEQQRLKLAAFMLSKGTMDSVFLLDEPTTGLHSSEIEKLCAHLIELSRRGNTIIAIEHNSDFILHADWVIDLGPGSGENGGKVIFNGPLEKFLQCKESLTARYIEKFKD